ncbi:MAG: L,D-transpeptidase family protein [Lachnospiraceae bacterium]|nr:L,D-transpeptidase family protein [Lachnospiraceae bacterium]
MRLRFIDRTLRNGILAGAALGVLTAVALGVGSSFGAEVTMISGTGNADAGITETAADPGAPVQQTGWQKDQSGSYRYYGQDGQLWVNAATPDGYYVDANGIWIPDQYDVSRLTSIPADARSLVVIEGHGTAARASLYVREALSGTASGDVTLISPGGMLPAQTEADASEPTNTWKKLVDVGGYVGWNGIGKEQEGDQKTPRGLFSLDQAFGTKPDPGNFNVPYLQVDDRYYWVGDSASPYYNTMVDIQKTGAVFDTAASEHLSTYGGSAYHYCMAVGYNKEQTPYKGSAIFLHCTDGAPGTGGCIAIPEAAMVTVLQNVTQPAYILIDDGENIKSY